MARKIAEICVSVNGVALRLVYRGSSGRKGWVHYSFICERDVIWPSLARMHALAKKHARSADNPFGDSEYGSPQNAWGWCLRTGTSVSDRAAFVAAVAAECRLP